MYKKFSYLIATMFGVGYCPYASGTAASLVTVPVAMLITYFWGFWGIVVATVVVFFVGVIATKEVLRYTKHDPSIVVIDEMAGQLLTYILLSIGLVGFFNITTCIIFLLGFVLFRLFDITKPQPARWADSKVLNAWGVMLDDIFAGIYAALILWGLVSIFSFLF